MQQKIRVNALAIIKNEGKLLALRGKDQVKKQNFLRLLGGGIEFGEQSVDALRREFTEEIGASLINEKLLTVIENIFEFNGHTGHEITFLYSANIRENNFFTHDRYQILDGEEGVCAEWIDIQEIIKKNIVVYPREAEFYIRS